MSRKIVPYPVALLSVLVEGIDERIEQFYEDRKGQKYFTESFYDAAVGVWVDTLQGRVDGADIRRIMTSTMKQARRKKQRWFESLKLNVEQIPIGEKGHPFSYIAESRRMLTARQWDQLYGKNSVNAIVKQKVHEVEEWAKNPDSLFIDYPALPSLTPKKVSGAFETDVLLSMFRTAKEKYDLKIEEFTQAYIDEMGEGAYFSGTRRTYEIPENGGPITDEIPMSEDGSKKLMVTISEEAFGDKNAMTMFDVKDLSLLMYITRRAANTMESTSVSIPLSELARVISNSGKATNPSQRYYTEAEQRLFRVTETTFKKIDDKTGRQTAAINFLGSAIRKEHGGVAYMDITLGPVISDAILNDKIRRTPAIDYERVTSRTGKIMLMALQRERIKAFGRYLRGAGQCVTIFTYSDFLSMVNFGTKVKHRNWKLIKETLINDFKENNLYIEDVVFDNVMTTATVYWLLLSEHEQQDLAYYGYGEVIDEQTV